MTTPVLDPQAQPFVRPDDLAARWHLNKKTILDAIKANEIPATRVGRRVLIPSAWIVAQEQASPIVAGS